MMKHLEEEHQELSNERFEDAHAWDGSRSSNPHDRPNIVLIIGEQQRHDMINVPYVQTLYPEHLGIG